MTEHPMNERAPGGETRGFLVVADVLHKAMAPRCADDPCVCTPEELERIADAANDVCNALTAMADEDSAVRFAELQARADAAVATAVARAAR